MESITIPDTGMTEEQDLDALHYALCEEMTEDQLIEEILSMAPEAPDLDEAGLLELDRATAELAAELKGTTDYATENDHRSQA